MKALIFLAAIAGFCAPGRAAACANDWTVYFDYGSSEIRADARATIDSFVTAFRSGYEVETVQVIGHSDQHGQPERRQRISERRARAVQEYLVLLGVPPSMIQVAGLSDREPQIDAGENVREPANRRARLVFQLSPAGLAALQAWRDAELAAGRQLPLC